MNDVILIEAFVAGVKKGMLEGIDANETRSVGVDFG